MIKWIYKPSGFCPVQAEGFFMGKYFYFRSRWSRATIEFADSEEDWKLNNLLKRYIVFEDKAPAAGWIPKWLAYVCIYRGLLLFLLKRKSHEEV